MIDDTNRNRHLLGFAEPSSFVNPETGCKNLPISGDPSPSCSRSRATCSPFGAVRIVLAALLLIAVGLKAHSLLHATATATNPGSSGRSAILIELAFAAWLFSGQIPQQLWKATIALFGLLAVLSLAHALRGHASCGCFGDLVVSPWLTFSFDILAVMALLRFPPTATDADSPVGDDVSNSPGAEYQTHVHPPIHRLGTISLSLVAVGSFVFGTTTFWAHSPFLADHSVQVFVIGSCRLLSP